MDYPKASSEQKQPSFIQKVGSALWLLVGLAVIGSITYYTYKPMRTKIAVETIEKGETLLEREKELQTFKEHQKRGDLAGQNTTASAANEQQDVKKVSTPGSSDAQSPDAQDVNEPSANVETSTANEKTTLDFDEEAKKADVQYVNFLVCANEAEPYLDAEIVEALKNASKPSEYYEVWPKFREQLTQRAKDNPEIVEKCQKHMKEAIAEFKKLEKIHETIEASKVK